MKIHIITGGDARGTIDVIQLFSHTKQGPAWQPTSTKENPLAAPNTQGDMGMTHGNAILVTPSFCKTVFCTSL